MQISFLTKVCNLWRQACQRRKSCCVMHACSELGSLVIMKMHACSELGSLALRARWGPYGACGPEGIRIISPYSLQRLLPKRNLKLLGHLTLWRNSSRYWLCIERLGWWWGGLRGWDRRKKCTGCHNLIWKCMCQEPGVGRQKLNWISRCAVKTSSCQNTTHTSQHSIMSVHWAEETMYRLSQSYMAWAYDFARIFKGMQVHLIWRGAEDCQKTFQKATADDVSLMQH